MRGYFLLAGLCVVAGCGSSGKIGGRPSWRSDPPPVGSEARVDEAKPIVLQPAHRPQAQYNAATRRPAPVTPLSDALMEALAETAAQLSVPAPVPDDRLFSVAADLASIVTQEAPLPYAVVEFSMRHHGIIEPSPHLITIWGSADNPELVVDQLRDRLPDILTAGVARVGVGVARTATGSVIVLAFQASYIDTQPIPRYLGEQESFRLQASVKRPYRDPSVFITHDDGSVESPSLIANSADQLVADIRCDGRRGSQRIEVTARDVSGSTVLANFPVWCGSSPPNSITIAPDADYAPASTEVSAQQRMFELVNRDRAAAGLPALVLEPKLVVVARGHSAQMYRTGRVVHVSATTGSAADRVAAGGVKTPLVLENVARAYSVAEAQTGLMESPGHRANLLAPEATHIGIGIVFGDGEGSRRELFVTQVFIRVPPVVSEKEARATIEKQISGTSRLRPHTALRGIAQPFAEELAAGATTAVAAEAANVRLDGVSGLFRKATTVVTAVADPETFDVSEVSGQPEMTHFGVGIAQGHHDVIGDNAIFVVVVIAQAR